MMCEHIKYECLVPHDVLSNYNKTYHHQIISHDKVIGICRIFYISVILLRAKFSRLSPVITTNTVIEHT